jgi:pimeloyl-ACP methyl ester carboxylesterase
MADAMRALKLPKCAAFGTHTGAALVLELARRHPDLITGAYFLGGVPIFNAEDRERLGDKYLPPVVIDELGGHLTSSWTRFRDQFIWFPWDLRSPRYYVPHDLLSDSDIHDWVVSIFRARKTFRPVADAAVHSGVTAPGAPAGPRRIRLLADRRSLSPSRSPAAAEARPEDRPADRRTRTGGRDLLTGHGAIRWTRSGAGR